MLFRSNTNTNTDITTAEIHDQYVAQINNLVSQGRESLIADLTADYERHLRIAGERRAA